jgi:hypothetical protein
MHQFEASDGTTDQNPDFDGCNSECRKAGKHSLRWGGCEQATPPEPTVSMSVVYTDHDGGPSIGFDTYTVPELARLIEPVLGDPLKAAAAARRIVHRHDEQLPAVPSAAAPPTQAEENMKSDPEKFLISGHGDNSLLICVRGDCEWSREFPMAEGLGSFMVEADRHTAEAHGIQEWVPSPNRNKPHPFQPRIFDIIHCETCWPRARRQAHAIHASSNRAPNDQP